MLHGLEKVKADMSLPRSSSECFPAASSSQNDPDTGKPRARPFSRKCGWFLMMSLAEFNAACFGVWRSSQRRTASHGWQHGKPHASLTSKSQMRKRHRSTGIEQKSDTESFALELLAMLVGDPG